MECLSSFLLKKNNFSCRFTKQKKERTSHTSDLAKILDPSLSGFCVSRRLSNEHWVKSSWLWPVGGRGYQKASIISWRSCLFAVLSARPPVRSLLMLLWRTRNQRIIQRRVRDAFPSRAEPSARHVHSADGDRPHRGRRIAAQITGSLLATVGRRAAMPAARSEFVMFPFATSVGKELLSPG